MGLDMYLTKKTYVKNWDHMKNKDLHSVLIKRGGKVRKDINPKRITYIEEEMGVWRKANAIHKWFVDHVQGGKDDCGTYYVSKEDMRELLGVVEEVLEHSELVKGKVNDGTTYSDGKEKIMWRTGLVIKDPAVAKKLLPVQQGFFFGSYDYDEYYYQDLVTTKEILLEALTFTGDGLFYYTSSW